MASFPFNPHRKSPFGVIDAGHLPVSHRLPRLANFLQETSVEGYCKPISAFPGDTIHFYVSALVEYQVTYLKLSDLVDISSRLSGKYLPLLPPTTYGQNPQPIPPDAWMNGCGWQVTFSLTIPDWPSGIYAAECRGQDGAVTYIVFIVKRKPTKRSFYAVLGNTNTWNAYNNWGGYSRYDKDREITLTSFERPNPFTSPTIAYDYSHPCHLTRAECWVLKWLNAEGYSVDVYSDYDFHSGIAHMDTYKALILTTHPEYWSVEMLDNLESYLNQGGSLLYLGGNGIFEKIKYTNSGDGLIFLDGTPQLRDNLYFRNLTPPRPERAILGVAFRYDNYWSATAPYRVINANHRFFTGTGLKDGDLIGHYGICGAASGREMDTSDMGTAPDGKIVSGWIELGDSGGNDRGTPPANLQILAIGINERSAAPGDNKLQGPHSAHMTYYDHSGGGFVLSAGSFLFGGSLVLDAKLQQIVRNALGGWLPDLIPINRRKFDISYLAPLLL